MLEGSENRRRVSTLPKCHSLEKTHDQAVALFGYQAEPAHPVRLDGRVPPWQPTALPGLKDSMAEIPMTWIVPIVGLLGLAVIAWAAWEAVFALRHLSVQQAAAVRLLAALEERLGTPEAYGAAHWREMERMEVRNMAAEERRWRSPLPDMP